MPPPPPPLFLRKLCVVGVCALAHNMTGLSYNSVLVIEVNPRCGMQMGWNDGTGCRRTRRMRPTGCVDLRGVCFAFEKKAEEYIF